MGGGAGAGEGGWLDGVAGPEPSPEFAAMVAEEYRRRLESLEDETLRRVALPGFFREAGPRGLGRRAGLGPARGGPWPRIGGERGRPQGGTSVARGPDTYLLSVLYLG